ncbi:MAG: hypothetical protein C4562_00105 [Actinobacteria bacterium]|nr:MAG: hypothetical protein C4562_00105 [Actinomycetota bacterium]
MKKVVEAIIITSIIISLILTPLGTFSAYKVSKVPVFSRVKQKTYMPGELLVKFKSSATSKIKSSIFRKAGVAKTLVKLGRRNKKNIFHLQLKKGISVSSALRKFKRDRRVSFAEPNYIRKGAYTPNDTDLSKQWGLYNYGQVIIDSAGTADADIDAKDAWDQEVAANAPTVAVIDSGVDISHPDLANKIWNNSDEVAGNNRDDDHNGYVDDVNGYNWAGISQMHHNASARLGHRGGISIYAQSITGNGRKLSSVALIIGRRGRPNFGIKLSVRSSLAGRNLAEANISSSEVVPAGDMVLKNLNRAVNLTEGQTYFIVMKVYKTSKSAWYNIFENHTSFADSLTNPYAGGFPYYHDGSSWRVMGVNDDFFFITNRNNDVRDDLGHGSHVAGIIGAGTNNNTGIAGVAPSAKIMPLKIIGTGNHLYAEDAAAAIYYAVDNGAKVINMSFGGYNMSNAEKQAVQDAYNAGVVLVASSGNDATSNKSYPASFSQVISVAATDFNDRIAAFSNLGNTIDICAPGVDIYSTVPTYPVGFNWLALNYDYMNGTSMAAPHVAGAAALFISKYPDKPNYVVKAALEKLSDDLGSAGWDRIYGYGRLNANSAMNGDNVAPQTPYDIKAGVRRYPGNYFPNKRIRLSWEADDNVKLRGYAAAINNDTSYVPRLLTLRGRDYTFRADNGISYFHIKSVDWFGNSSATVHYVLKVDTFKPLTYANYRSTAYQNRTARIYYYVSDKYSENKAYVTIVIGRANSRGRMVTAKTLSLGLVDINKWSSTDFIANLPKGTYQFVVRAIDQAANRQRRTGGNVLVVK